MSEIKFSPCLDGTHTVSEDNILIGVTTNYNDGRGVVFTSSALALTADGLRSIADHLDRVNIEVKEDDV